jgi:flagellar biosynthesis/type III secretory pathway protein FliH
MPPTATHPQGVQRPDPQVRSLPASLEPLAPSSVVEASRSLSAAQADREAARVAAEQARQAVSTARTADEQAALEAAREGRRPKAASAPKAEAKADEAARSYEAHQQLARQAAAAMLSAVREARDELAEAAEAELVEVAGRTTEHLNALEAALARAAEVRFFLKALDPGALQGREASFVPAWAGRRQRDPVPKAARELLDDLRAALG